MAVHVLVTLKKTADFIFILVFSVFFLLIVINFMASVYEKEVFKPFFQYFYLYFYLFYLSFSIFFSELLCLSKKNSAILQLRKEGRP